MRTNAVVISIRTQKITIAIYPFAFAVSLKSGSTFLKYLFMKKVMYQMCPIPKDPICNRKLLYEPARSPKAEKRSAIVISHGHSQNEANAAIPTGIAILL